MRLLCYTQFYPPSVGGMQISNMLLIEGLVEAGATVELHVFASDDKDVSQENGFQRYNHTIKPQFVFEHYLCARNIVKKAKEFKPDFVLLLDEGMVRALGFFLFVKKDGQRYISVNSGSTLTRGASHFRGRVNAYMVRRGYHWLELLFVAQSTAVALPEVCPDVSDQVRILGRPIPNNFFLDVSPKSSMNKSDNGLPTFFSCARAEEEKGIGLVLKALGRLRDQNGAEVCNFIFAGDGPALKSWRRLAQELSLHNIHFVGRLSLDDLLQYYHSCYMCIFPSHGAIETFGRTWIEAFACSKPVISTDNDNLKYLVSDGVNAIVIQPTVDSVCNGIQRALDLDVEEYEEMCSHARETGWEYKQSTIVDKFSNALRELN